MKKCPKCNSEVENSFEICWNCNYTFPEEPNVELEDISRSNNETDIKCIRCNVPLIYNGNFKFQTGVFMGILTQRESLDLYTCPKCRKVEFYSPEEE